MIDFDSHIYTHVYNALHTAISGVFVTGETVSAPSSFPTVSIVEIDNATHESTSDSSVSENHARIAYQVDVYSNLDTGSKSECRKIINIADAAFAEIGLVRFSMTPISDASSKSRLAARYRCVISKEGVTYRK